MSETLLSKSQFGPMWQTKYNSAVHKIWEWELIFGRVVKAISSPGVRSPDAKRDRCHPRCIHLQVIEIQHEFCNNNMPVLSVLSRVLGIFILVTFQCQWGW